MDPTIVATIAGTVGVVVGAVIGGLFTMYQTKRQIEVMMLQSRGDVNERLYSQSLEILRFFAENPELRPYFYDNKDLADAAGVEKLRVLSAAEMVSGFMELVALQLADQPAEIQPKWKAYLLDAYSSSAVIREHLASCTAWYCDDLLSLLPVNSNETATQIASGKPDA